MTQAPSRARPWNPPDVFASPRPPPRMAVASPVAAPAWTAADVTAAHEQGLYDGAQAAQRETMALIAAAMQQIAATIAVNAEASTALVQHSADALANVLVRAFVAAFPGFESRFGGDEVARLAACILPGLAREPALTLRAASGAADALAAVVAGLPQAQRTRIAIELDATLGDADLRVTWQDGTAERDAAAIRDEVIAALIEVAGAAMTERSDP